MIKQKRKTTDFMLNVENIRRKNAKSAIIIYEREERTDDY